MSDKIHIFWDNSNIWLVGRNEGKRQEPEHFDTYPDGFRIEFSHLLEYVRNKRDIESAFLAGSVPTDNQNLWNTFKRLNVTVETQQRGADDGKEVAVDQAIQFKMQQCLLNQVISKTEPQTMVLLTGDGNGHQFGTGFIPVLKQAHDLGWKIEVWAWDIGCNTRLKEFAMNNGQYHDLALAYNYITFFKYMRTATQQP